MSDGRRSLPGKPLAELSDAELNAELNARRRLRGATFVPADHAKHYASLELAEGATLDAIEQAYARLRAKYEPFALSNDVERSRAAKRLLEALQKAYDALTAHSAGSTSR